MKIEVVDGKALITLENDQESCIIYNENLENEAFQIQKDKEQINLIRKEPLSTKSEEQMEVDGKQIYSQDKTLGKCDEFLKAIDVIINHCINLNRRSTVNVYPTDANRIFHIEILSNNNILIRFREIRPEIELYLYASMYLKYGGKVKENIIETEREKVIFELARLKAKGKDTEPYMDFLRQSVVNQPLSKLFLEDIEEVIHLAKNIETEKENGEVKQYILS